nr:hypothetical protein [Tanacetum cinerariifolium]
MIDDKDDAVALIDDKEEEKKEGKAKVADYDQIQERQAESQAKIYKINMDHASKVLSMQEDEPAEVQGITISTAEPQVPAATITVALQQVEMDEEYARKLHEELNKDIDWDVAIEHVKQKAKEDPFVQRYQGMSYDDIRPIFETKFNSNIEFLLKTKEQLEEEKNRAIQSINKTSAQKAAKGMKLNEEVKDLKKHLEIVPDKDDEVYTDATPLARKVPVVD